MDRATTRFHGLYHLFFMEAQSKKSFPHDGICAGHLPALLGHLLCPCPAEGGGDHTGRQPADDRTAHDGRQTFTYSHKLCGKDKSNPWDFFRKTPTMGLLLPFGGPVKLYHYGSGKILPAGRHG